MHGVAEVPVAEVPMAPDAVAGDAPGEVGCAGEPRDHPPKVRTGRERGIKAYVRKHRGELADLAVGELLGQKAQQLCRGGASAALVVQRTRAFLCSENHK
jgi:hypothetical protein